MMLLLWHLPLPSRLILCEFIVPLTILDVGIEKPISISERTFSCSLENLHGLESLWNLENLHGLESLWNLENLHGLESLWNLENLHGLESLWNLENFLSLENSKLMETFQEFIFIMFLTLGRGKRKMCSKKDCVFGMLSCVWVQASKEFIHRGCVVDGLCLFVCMCVYLSVPLGFILQSTKKTKKKHTPSLYKTWWEVM